MRQSKTTSLLLGVITLIVLFMFSFPFIWMLLASFKTQAQIMSTSNFFVFSPTFDNFVTVMAQHKFLKFIINSFIIASGATVFSLILGIPASFAIAKYRLQSLSLVILIAKIIPGIIFLVPWYMVFSGLGWVDSYKTLILSHMLIALPYIVWIMIPFFETLPEEIQESGQIDGASKFQVFLRIVLPISAPGYLTCSLLAFIHSWNNFLFSLTLSGDQTKTLPVAMFNFMSYAQIDWGAIMAATCIITLPVITLALMTQRYIISGLSAGAVKG